jgi:hypothetical protein
MKFTHIDKLFNSRDEILNEYKFDAVLFFNDHIKIPSYYQKINLIFSLDDKISVKDASRLISNFDLLVRVGYYPDLFGFVGEKMSLYIKYIEELYAENIKRFAYNIKSFDRLVILESDKDNLIIKQILGQLQNVKEVFLCKIETKNQSLLISQQPIGYILSKNPKIDCLYLGSNNDLPLVICEHGKYYRFISAISNIMQGISIVPCVIDIINILDKSIKIEQNLSRYTDIKCQNIASFKAFLKSAKFSNDIILIIDKIKQFLTKFSEIPFKYKDFIAEINQLFNFDINTDLNIGIKSIQDLKDIALLEYKMTQNNNLYSYINDINNVHDNIVIHITDNLIAKYNIGNPNAKKQMKHDIGCAINSSKNAIICLDLKDSINSIIARKELCDILQKATKCSD